MYLSRPPTTARPIYRELRRMRERQAAIALVEADAIAMVSTNVSAALRLAWIASELRRELLEGVL